jgi:hypothetical protein
LVLKRDQHLNANIVFGIAHGSWPWLGSAQVDTVAVCARRGLMT